jgi:nucleoid DNA-binding protein
MSLGKKYIIKNISSKAEISNENSTRLLTFFLELIKHTSRKKTLKISNFGTFFFKDTPKRIGRNPRTKEEFAIPTMSKLYFKPATKIKNLLN